MQSIQELCDEMWSEKWAWDRTHNAAFYMLATKLNNILNSEKKTFAGINLDDDPKNPVDAMARILMAAWVKSDPASDVTNYPASYVATFVDMAEAALTQVGRTNAEIVEARESNKRVERALTMYDQAFPDQHAGPCSHVACQMARTLRRTW